MIGSLHEFINANEERCFKSLFQTRNVWESRPSAQTEKQPQEYKADDKTQLLKKFNRKAKMYSTSKTAKEKRFSLDYSQLYNPSKKRAERKQTSMFLETEPGHDKIALAALTRNHNLLRAIVKTEEAEANRRNTTEYEESLQRMKVGFSKISTQPAARPIPFEIQVQNQTKQLKKGKSQITEHFVLMSDGNINQRKLRIEKSLKWGKKRHLQGQLYYKSLGHTVNAKRNSPTMGSKSLFNEKRMLLKQIKAHMRNIKEATDSIKDKPVRS